MSAQAWFSRNDVDVTPGTAVVLQITVVNLSDSTDSFTVTPAGLAAGWTTVQPAVITLFGGSQQVLDVEVHPPLLPSTTAGPCSLAIRVVPQSDPDDIGTAETTLHIAPSYDRRISLLQPALRSRRTGRYELMLENRGNTLASCRLHLADPSGRVEADFDPPAAGVEAGASTLVRVKVRANRLQWERRARTIAFRIDADQQGSPTVSTQGTLVQASMVPERLLGRAVATFGALALLAGAWLAVVKPAIDDAAEQAVIDRTPTTTTVATDGGVAPTGSTVQQGPSETTVAVTTPPDAGRPFAGRLLANVAPGQTGSESITVPSGQRLQVTDIILQNPSTDTGTATLRRGSEVLFTWRLDFVLNDDAKAFVTPIEVAGGEQLTFEVTCTASGDATLGVCSPALQTLGLLVSD